MLETSNHCQSNNIYAVQCTKMRLQRGDNKGIDATTLHRMSNHHKKKKKTTAAYNYQRPKNPSRRSGHEPTPLLPYILCLMTKAVRPRRRSPPHSSTVHWRHRCDVSRLVNEPDRPLPCHYFHKTLSLVLVTTEFHTIQNNCYLAWPSWTGIFSRSKTTSHNKFDTVFYLLRNVLQWYGFNSHYNVRYFNKTNEQKQLLIFSSEFKHFYYLRLNYIRFFKHSQHHELLSYCNGKMQNSSIRTNCFIT